MEAAERALQWLQQGLGPFRRTPGSALPRFDLNGVSTAVYGSVEAQRYLQLALVDHLEVIMDHARTLANLDYRRGASTLLNEIAPELLKPEGDGDG